MRRGVPIGAAVAAVMLGTVGNAATARTDVGEILVAQTTADGHVVCARDIVVGNIRADQTVTAPVCAGAVSARILNETNEAVRVRSGATVVSVDRFVGVTIAVPAKGALAFDIPKGW